MSLLVGIVEGSASPLKGTPFCWRRGQLLRSQRTGRPGRAIRRAGASAELRVGYVWGLFHSSVPLFLQRFRTAHPGVAVHLFDWTATQQADALREGRLDAGFIGFAEEADEAGLVRQSVGCCAIQAVLPVNHPGARKGRVRLASLSRESFLVISERNYPGAARLALEACSHADSVLEFFKRRIAGTPFWPWWRVVVAWRCFRNP